MFSFFRTAAKLKEVDQATANSFNNVKSDIESLSTWVSFLYDENVRLKEKLDNVQRVVGSQVLEINDLKTNFRKLPVSSIEIKSAVEKYSDFDHLFKRLGIIEEKIDVIESRHRSFKSVVREPVVREVHHVPITHNVPVKPVSSSALKEKFMRRLARNSKEYIKNVVKGLVHKYGRMSALQLRDIVVDEQGLCSKSSFYRILEEMEAEKFVAPVQDGKNKVFVPAP